MLNEELEKYKNLYSQLLSALADHHNTHLIFIKRVGRDTGMHTRKNLRAIAKIANDMKKQGQKLCKVSLQIKRSKRARLEEEKKSKKTKKDDMVIPK